GGPAASLSGTNLSSGPSAIPRVRRRNMSTAVRMERTAEVSPHRNARIAGFFYLLTIVARMFVEIYVRSRLVVSDDGAAKATNIMAHGGLFRCGCAADSIAFARYVGVTSLWLGLDKPWNRSL